MVIQLVKAVRVYTNPVVGLALEKVPTTWIKLAAKRRGDGL